MFNLWSKSFNNDLATYTEKVVNLKDIFVNFLYNIFEKLQALMFIEFQIIFNKLENTGNVHLLLSVKRSETFLFYRKLKKNLACNRISDINLILYLTIATQTHREKLEA